MMKGHMLTGQTLRALAAVVALGALWTIAPHQAKAGSLDRALLDHSGEIVSYLKMNGIQTVGVLPFKVKKGARQASYFEGPLATGLPRRLENALIMTMEPDEKRAVGVIRGAVATANRAGVGPYRSSAASYAKLFTQGYDLAWGSKKVKAEAFLTGTVVNDGDRSQTALVVELLTPGSFRAGNVKPAHTWKFEARTDRRLLSDLGYNYSLSPAALRRGVTALRRDQAAVDQVNREDNKGDTKPKQGQCQSEAHTLDNVGGFAFDLEYNGARQKVQSLSPNQGGKQLTYEAPPAMPASKIALHLTRMDTEARRLGLLVMVNGKSTWKLEEAEPITCRKWIYDATAKGRRDEWLGFYTDVGGKNLQPFRVLTAEESQTKASELGSRAGWIDIHVFGSKEKCENPNGKAEKQMLVSTRGMPRSRSKAQSLRQLRSDLLQANRVKERASLVHRREAGGLILHELEAVEGGAFTTDELPNPEEIAHVAIRYWSGGSRKIQK